jgi:hypothetical protein
MDVDFGVRKPCAICRRSQRAYSYSYARRLIRPGHPESEREPRVRIARALERREQGARRRRLSCLHVHDRVANHIPWHMELGGCDDVPT